MFYNFASFHYIPLTVSDNAAQTKACCQWKRKANRPCLVYEADFIESHC